MFIRYQTGAARARPGWNDNSGIAEMLPGVWRVLYILRRRVIGAVEGGTKRQRRNLSAAAVMLDRGSERLHCLQLPGRSSAG